ncbi:MAG: hypothetical protein AB1538_10640 [Bacillota bacterium]
MATKSFIKEFSVNKKNALNVVKALANPKAITLYQTQRVENVKKGQIKKFFKMED